MFIGSAINYYGNTPFRVKMVLLVLAGLNMLVFQLVTFRGVAASGWREAGECRGVGG